MSLEQATQSEYAYRGKVVNLRIDTVNIAGAAFRREVVEHDAVVAIVAIDEQGDLLLVRQYRPPTGRTLLEIPAGGIDPGETPEDAVQREMQEETGYRPRQMQPLTGFYVAPGYCTEYIHLFLVSDLVASRLQPDDDEQIEVERMPLTKALEMMESGEICDAKTIIGLLYMARYMTR